MARMLTILLFGFGLTANAQDDFLDSWSILQKGNEIELNWTIAEGNTCEGTFISRSVNGNLPVPVFAIGGICGSPGRPESYRYTDTDTGINGTYVYSITFGSESSLTMQIQFLQYWSSGIIIFYEPASGSHRFRIDNDGRPYDLQLYNLCGDVDFAVNEEVRDEFLLPTQAWSNGVYVVRAYLADRQIVQKFLINR
jgi:hypothetical protein